MMKSIFFAVAAVVSTVAFGGVYDDVVWMMRPADLNGDGIINNDEVINGLKGGVPDHSSNKCTVYGYDANRTLENVAVDTVYTSGLTMPALHISDATTVTKEDGTYYYPGAIVSTTAIRSCMPVSSTAFTMIVRTKCEDVVSNTRWFFNWGLGSLGFHSSGVRLFALNSASYDPMTGMPVANNTWIDLAATFTWQPEDVGGVMITTGRVHVVMMRQDTGDTLYTFDNYTAASCVPNSSSVFKIGVESEKSESKTKPDAKRYKGWIQQLSLWNRKLSDDEIMEAFKYSGRDKALVGVANTSGDEFGGTGTDIVMDGDWKDVPKTLAAGESYTVKFAGVVDSARAFKVKGASGSTTLQVGAASVDIAEDGEASFFVPRAVMSEEGGVVSFALKNAGSADLTLDCLSLTDNVTVTNSVTYTSHVTDPIEVPQDTVLVINVPEGKNVELQGVISGDGQIVKVGAGTLKPTAANTLTGGFAVREGALCSAGGTFGSGPVTVIANGTTPSQLTLNGTFANNIYVEGESSDACPAIHFAEKTTLNGDLIASNAVVYLSTAWEDTAAQANTENVTIAGRADATGGTIALAPHCKVNFKKTIYCELLKLYWRPNSATEDGGNPGIVVLATHGDMKNAPQSAVLCYMKNVEIDQTRIIQGGQNIFGSSNGYEATNLCSTVRWTGEHKTGGSIDMNGSKMNMGRVYTFETTPDDYTSQRIINTGASTPFCNLLDNNEAGCFYCQLEGGTKGSINCQASGHSKGQILKNRHHRGVTFSGAQFVAITGGTTFEGGVTISSSASIQITNLTAGAYIKDTTLTFGSTTAWVMDQSAVDALATDYSLSLISTKAGKVSAPAGSVLRLKKATCTSNIPAGTYANTFSGSSGSFTLSNGGTIHIMTEDGSPVNLGNIRWDGEKWVDADDGEVTPGVAAGYQIVQASGGTATLATATDVNLYGISLAVNGGSLTLNSQDDKTISVWNGGLRVEGDAIDAGSSYTFNAPIMLQGVDAYIQIPTNGTCALNGGISGRGNVTLNGSADAACGHPSPYNTGAESGETDGGVFYLNGDNTFSGNLTASNAVFHLKGTLGLPGDTSTFYARADSGQDANKVYHHYMGNFYFKGFDCYKAMDVKSGSSSDPNYGYAVIFDEGTTNTFHSTFHWNSSTIVRFLADSQTMFKKTVTFDNSVKLYPMAGAVLDFEGPFKAPNTTKANVGIEGRAGTHLIFNSKGNVSGTFLNFNGADMVIDINETDAFQIGTYFQLGSAVDNTCTLNLNNGARISAPEFLTSENVTVHGEGEGAAVEITDGSTEKHAVKCQLTGTAGLVMSGAGTCSVSGCRGLSTGELVAKSGVISMDAASTWAGAVRVCGGTLNLTGVKKVAAIYDNDSTKSLPEGLYGAVGSGAPHEVAWITGTGKLRIGNAGMLFIVK